MGGDRDDSGESRVLIKGFQAQSDYGFVLGTLRSLILFSFSWTADHGTYERYYSTCGCAITGILQSAGARC